MAKAASPIRLQDDLMQAAELTAKRFHRSTAEQIEYWADLGRSVSSTLDPDVVFEALESDRKAGTLRNAVTNSTIRYQASLEHPGYLEQIDSNGNVTTGRFENGQFIALNGFIS